MVETAQPTSFHHCQCDGARVGICPCLPYPTSAGTSLPLNADPTNLDPTNLGLTNADLKEVDLTNADLANVDPFLCPEFPPQNICSHLCSHCEDVASGLVQSHTDLKESGGEGGRGAE